MERGLSEEFGYLGIGSIFMTLNQENSARTLYLKTSDTSAEEFTFFGVHSPTALHVRGEQGVSLTSAPRVIQYKETPGRSRDFNFLDTVDVLRRVSAPARPRLPEHVIIAHDGGARRQ